MVFHKLQTGQMELKVMQLREGSRKNNYFLDAGKKRNNKVCSTACAPDTAGSASSLERLLSRLKGAGVRQREMRQYSEKREKKYVVLKFLPCEAANSVFFYDYETY